MSKEVLDALAMSEIPVRHFHTEVSGQLKNGCHMHLSLSGGDIGLAEPFLAGILAKIRPLCALGMANVESYARVIHDGAGLFIGWGTDNRDLPVRKVGERHWEFRIVDATSNAYLFLAALLKEYGIIDAMPNSLGDTLEALKSDADFADWLGQDCLQQYVSGKEEEIGRFGIMDEEERRRKFVEYF
ncbi:glutamine synthetase [Hypoxylon argillaceum]|nr:glutamine synthetase [Hypoxylon argillaceum]